MRDGNDRVPGMRVVVVGGGVTGLAAAAELRRLAGPHLQVTVIDQSDRLGGKLWTGELAGHPVERGAEAFLVRVPEALHLARQAGLADSLVHPAPVFPGLVVDGQLRRQPAGTLLGVPGDLEALAAAEVLSQAGLERVRSEPPLDAAELIRHGDVAVGALVRRQLGDQIVDRLVDPLLGGVYAGRADNLSLAATMPGLYAQLERHTSMVEAAAAAQREAPRVDGPVFATPKEGLSCLIEAVAKQADAQYLLGAPVRELTLTAQGWRLVLGDTRDPEVITADGVVLAVPARPAARLVSTVSPVAAAEIGGIDYASVALVGLALPTTELPALSGLLVPATEGYLVKAFTFFSRKWPHLATDGLTVVRASLGRYGEEQTLQRTDDELVALVRRELSAIVGRPLPEPVDTVVTRWGGALPQYAPGHLDRVRRARAALDKVSSTREGPPAIALAGAAYDGVGIPACIRSGQTAAARVWEALTRRGSQGETTAEGETDHE